MLGSIYIGLSGMDAYSKGLQVISNNVANLNSNGFKQTSLAFTDLFSGTGGRSYLGGGFGNGGSGVHIGSSLIDFHQGELRQTGNDLDLGIQGSGFLVVLDKDGKTFYTRTGSFAVDKDGYIADQVTGDRLAVLDATGHPVAVNINAKQTSAPAPTTKITFSDNLSSSATTASVSNITVYDDRGGKHVWSVDFTKSTTVADQWDINVKDESGTSIGTSSLKFIGSIVDSTTATSTVHLTPTGASAMDVTLDFSTGVTSFSAGTASTLRAASVDGNAVGTLSTVTVDDNGQIKLTYTNEKTELEGAVAIADFRSPQKLERTGDGLYVNGGSEAPRYLASATGGVGKLTPKTIEASNVDLSAEFGDLILIQRGFQACSQVVSVSNDMIQQLFAIRGQ